MRKNRRPRGFRSNIGVTKEKGHNNGEASNYYRESNVLYGIINDREFRERDSVKWRKNLWRRASSIYYKIKSGRYRGERRDFELLAFVSQVYYRKLIQINPRCSRELVKMNLWAISNLIDIASTSELYRRVMQRHSLAENMVYIYGDKEDQAEWRRLGRLSLTSVSRH